MYADSLIMHNYYARQASLMRRDPSRWMKESAAVTGLIKDPAVDAAATRLQRAGSKHWEGGPLLEGIFRTDNGIIYMGQPTSRYPTQKVLPPIEGGPTNRATPVYSAPTQPVSYKKLNPVPRETLQRIEPRIPIPPSSFARTPISVPQPSYTRPSYRFTPGFVDPRVAASARQSAADGELLTREQLEYRNRVMRRQATPMTF